MDAIHKRLVEVLFDAWIYLDAVLMPASTLTPFIRLERISLISKLPFCTHFILEATLQWKPKPTVMFQPVWLLWKHTHQYRQNVVAIERGVLFSMIISRNEHLTWFLLVCARLPVAPMETMQALAWFL